MLTSLTEGTPNSFGFLRWVMAVVVLIDHSYVLSGLGNDPTWFTRNQDTMGGVAVAGFFIMSGFLVTRSQLTRRGTGRFLWKRFLRIFPGYWVCLIITAFGFASIAWLHERGALTAAFLSSSGGPFSYLTGNFLLHVHQYGIDGLLEGTPYGKVAGGPFDGSLWTLLYEFKCYLLIALLGATKLLWRKSTVPLLTLVFYVYTLLFQYDHSWVSSLGPPLDDIYLARFGCLFLLGATMALFAERIPLDDRLGIAAVLVVLATWHWGSWIAIGYPAFAYTLLWLAGRLPMHSWDHLGDMSYGVYIYAFPVQMTLADHDLQKHGIAAFILASFAITTVLALLSWNLVERRALGLKSLSLHRLKPRHRRLTQSATGSQTD
jgi:peptidoglycan/LPS O-acetylase OafA/YrhL